MSLRKHFHRNYLYITGIVCSAIWFLDMPGKFAALAVAVLLLGGLLYFRLFREVIILLLALTLGGVFTFHTVSSQSNVRNQRLENATVRIIDPRAQGPAINPDDTVPYTVNAEIIKGPDLGKVQLYFPHKLINPGVDLNCNYLISGNFYTWQNSAAFFKADKNGKWRNVSKSIQNNGYFNYLQRNKLTGRVVVESLQTVDPPDGYGKHLSLLTRKVRQAVKRLEQGIENSEHRAILSAVTLGMRSRLPPATVKSFNAVGISHLFSISGLHIGVLAGLILLLARPLPLIWHWLLNCTLLIYVLAAGGNAPAMRAFCMVIGMEFFRSMYLKINPLEFLSLICAFFLLVNPYYLIDAGFIYSFVITACLIVSIERTGEITAVSCSPAKLLGQQNFFCRIHDRIKLFVVGGLIFSLTAALASMPLVLLFQDIIFAGSMLINFLILPVLLPLFICSMGKMIFVHPQWLWNNLLDFMLEYICRCAEFFCNWTTASPVMHISWIAAVLWLLSLLWLLQTRIHKHFLIALALLITVICGIFLRSGAAPERVYAVIYGGNIINPVAAIMLPQAHEMYLLNCNNQAIYPLRDTAAAYGINRIVRLDFGKPLKDCANGLESLQSIMPIEKFRKSSQKVRSKVFQSLTGRLPGLTGGAMHNTLSITGSGTVDLALTPSDNGGYEFLIQDQKFNIPRTSRVQVYIVEKASGNFRKKSAK